MVAALFQVEAMRLEQIFGQPEEVEIPGAVAQELGADKATHFTAGKEHGHGRRQSGVLACGDDVPGGRAIGQEPPERPGEAEPAGNEENPPPARQIEPVPVGQNARDQGRCDDGAHCRPGIDEAHGGRAAFRRKPFGNGAGGGGEAAALPYAQ